MFMRGNRVRFQLKVREPRTGFHFKIMCYACLLVYHFRWVEKWLRRWRTVFCGHAAHIGQQVGRVDVTTGLGSVSDRCKQTVRDIRQAFCERSV